MENEDGYYDDVTLMKGEKMMKRVWILVYIGCFLIVPGLVAGAQLNDVPQSIFGGGREGIHLEELKVLQLEVSPDPVRNGERVTFQATISNSSRYSGRVALSVADKDQIISQTIEATLRPGDNLIEFPGMTYRFTRSDHCLTIMIHSERSKAAISGVKDFCANKTKRGWTLNDEKDGQRSDGRLSVEDLKIYPDPVSPGQEIRFTVRLKNDGRHMRGDIQIRDRDQVVAQLENAVIPSGVSEFKFPRGRYSFQRMDTCFTVTVDIERRRHPIYASNEFCAKPVGWTLERKHGERPGGKRKK